MAPYEAYFGFRDQFDQNLGRTEIGSYFLTGLAETFFTRRCPEPGAIYLTEELNELGMRNPERNIDELLIQAQKNFIEDKLGYNILAMVENNPSLVAFSVNFISFLKLIQSFDKTRQGIVEALAKFTGITSEKALAVFEACTKPHVTGYLEEGMNEDEAQHFKFVFKPIIEAQTEIYWAYGNLILLAHQSGISVDEFNQLLAGILKSLELNNV